MNKKAMPQFYRVFKIFAKNYKPIPLEVYKTPYEVLISTLISSRTNDDTTLPAAERLFKKAQNLEQLDQLEIRTIENLIYPVGFYRTKAKNIKKLAKIILTEHGGDVPDTAEELMSLPGAGRKTANLILVRAFDMPAISVDTHVHRISNMLGWVATKTPEQTERELTKILPKKYWKDTNRLFVSIGRQYRSKKKLEEFLKKNSLLPSV